MGTLVREKVLFKPHDEYRTELKSFCRMYCHERYAFTVCVVIIVKIGHKRYLGEEIDKLVICIALFPADIYKVLYSVHKLLDVFLTRFAFDTIVTIHVIAYSAIP